MTSACATGRLSGTKMRPRMTSVGVCARANEAGIAIGTASSQGAMVEPRVIGAAKTGRYCLTQRANVGFQFDAPRAKTVDPPIRPFTAPPGPLGSQIKGSDPLISDVAGDRHREQRDTN